MIKKNNFKRIAGMTLVEILIGVIMTSLMMAAMYTTYNAVNKTYSQVTDRAMISRSGRDIVGMLMRDIRMSGFKYFGDTLTYDVSHAPVTIGIDSSGIDKISIVYGDYDLTTTPRFKRYRISYYAGKENSTDGYFAIYKSKEEWDEGGLRWEEIYSNELIKTHLVDMEFVPVDDRGLRILTPLTLTSNSSKLYDVRAIDVRLTFRSKNEFYKSSTVERVIHALGSIDRHLGFTDKFFRDNIVITVHTRNIGT